LNLAQRVPSESGWRRVTLGEVLTLINGRAYKQDELLEQGTPVIRIQNLNGGDNWYYSDLTLPDDKYCDNGDLLFAWSATFGPYFWSGSRAIYHYHIWKIVPSPGLDKNFAFHLLQSITERVKASGRGISMIHMTKAGMEAWEVDLPPLDEQRRIAAILDKADALRRKRKRTIGLLDNLTQSIFLEMFGDDQHQWTKLTFGEVVQEFRYGTSNKSAHSGFPVLRIPNVIGGKIDLSDLKTVPLEQKEFRRLQMREGDILLVRTNGNPDYVGRCAVFDRTLENRSEFSNTEFVFASYLIRARLTTETFNPYFVQTFLSSAVGRRALLERSKTSAGQFNINTEGLSSIRIPAPPRELQDTFAKRREVVQSSIAACSRNSKSMEYLFSSLQSRAFSGQL
jgi:type I restriction enzyme S subunit